MLYDLLKFGSSKSPPFPSPLLQGIYHAIRQGVVSLLFCGQFHYRARGVLVEARLYGLLPCVSQFHNHLNSTELVSFLSSLMPPETAAFRLMSGARSTKGCWTCRLRRKKCDEAKPSCGVCLGLGIDCDGYGPRPSWMERGPLEREQAAKVRSKIALQKSLRGQSAINHDGSTIVNDRDKSHSTQAAQQRNNSVSSREAATATVQTSVTLGDQGQGPLVGGISLASPTPMAMAPDAQRQPYSNAESSFGGTLPAQWDEIPWDCDWNFDTTDVTPGNPDGPGPAWFSPCVGATTNLSSGEPSSTSLTTSEPSHLSMSSPALRSDFSPHKWSMDSQTPAVQRQTSVEDASLLACYTSEDDDLPFRLGASLSLRRSNWISFLLLCSEHVRDLSVAHARTQRALETDRPQAACHSHVATVQRVHASFQVSMRSGAADASQTSLLVLEAYASLLQGLYIEMLCGRLGQYRELMTASSTDMAALLDLAAQHSQHSAGARVGWQRRTMYLQSAAAKSILGHLVWQDMVNSILFDDEPATGLDLGDLLSSDIVDMLEVCGCPNRLALTLHDIAALARWKAECERSNCLDVFQLAKRGTSILARVDATYEHRDGLRSGAHHLPSVYMGVARLYVQAVVSGPSQQLSQVQDLTDNLIAELQQLGTFNALGHAWWVLCIIGCFSDNRQLALLQDMTEGTCKAQRGMCATALAVAYEYHRMRREQDRRCHWVHVLHSAYRSRTTQRDA